MQWLEQTREALRKKEVNLSGRFELSPQEAETVEGFIRSMRQAIENLGSGVIAPKVQKLIDAHIDGFGRTIERVYKGARRAERKGLADRTPLTPKMLGDIHGEYQGHVAFLLGLSDNHSSSIFNKASITTPYWKAKDLDAQLTDERITEELHKGGIEMTLEEVRGAFPRSVRLHFAVGNRSDPLEAIGRVAEHMEKTLTDERIMEELGKRGIAMSKEEVREAFPKSVRFYFAVNKISDPLEACIQYAKGEIAYAGRYFKHT